MGVGKGVDAIRLNRQLSYLRVSSPDRVVLMVLGYSQHTPQGAIDTWYSSVGEVLQLQNGRVLSTVGFEPDWRSVSYSSLPSWRNILAKGNAEFLRSRDEMPGYKFGISETIKLYKVPAPSNARLKDVPSNSLLWFEEAVVGTTHGLPSARYGIATNEGAPVVVYGEQCFSVDRCIAWQVWPASL